MIRHLTKAATGLEFCSPPAQGKLCQSLGGLPPGMAEYRGLASDGRQRYKKYKYITTKTQIRLAIALTKVCNVYKKSEFLSYYLVTFYVRVQICESSLYQY